MAKKDSNKKSIFRKFKETWAVPRLRALITLGLYGLFFLCIFIYITVIDYIGQSAVSNPVQEVDSFTAFKSMKSYEYIYDIESTVGMKSLSYKVEGIHTDSSDSFSVNNYKFYIQDSIIYSKTEGLQITDILPIDLMMITPVNLSKYFITDYLTNKIEYENGDIKAVFDIPVYNFNIAFLQNISLDNSNYVTVTVYVVDNEIQKISINLYELMKLVDVNIKNYTIDITYSNINNIKSVEEF